MFGKNLTALSPGVQRIVVEPAAVENGNGLGDRALLVLRSNFAVAGDEICGLVVH